MEERSFLAIDEHRLDKEWLNQAELYYKYAKRLARSRRALDDAKALLDLTSAEMDLAVRRNPELYGIEKVSEAAVKAAVPRTKKYKAAMETFLQAKHEVDVRTGAVVALEHRKRALEKLVDMWMKNYFADPKHSTDGEARNFVEKKGRTKNVSGVKRKTEFENAEDGDEG